MRYGCCLSIIAFILLISGFACGDEYRTKESFISGAKHQEYIPGEVLIAFKTGTPDRIRYDTHKRCGAIAAYPSFSGGFERVKFDSRRKVGDIISSYESNPDVLYAEPNYIAHALLVPNDPLYSRQWHFHSPEDAPGGANLERAWDISTGEGVIVAVLDTGVAYENYRSFRQAPDLSDVCFVPGYDFVDHDSHPNDENGHGTLVTGVIAQQTNNGVGTAGAAFNCCIMPVRVLDEDGYGSYAGIIEGVNFAVKNGAKVINMSFGSDYPSTSLMLTLRYAHNMGVTLVVAAGNEYQWGSPKSYPAAYDAYCIAVGAVSYDGRRAIYSTTGDFVDISAPGGDLSMDQNGDGFPDGILQQSFVESPGDFEYIYGEGTSFAAPLVSAAVAMLISCGLTDPDEIVEVLKLSARDVGMPGWDSEYGYGILDVYTAIKYAAKMTLARSEGTIPNLHNVHGRLIMTVKDSDFLSESPQENTNMISAYSYDLSSQLTLDGSSNSNALYQNYPSPFNPDTWIPYQLAKDANVIIRIYDSTGRLIRKLDLGHRPAGRYLDRDRAAYWDGKSDLGEETASGIYFYNITAGDFSATRKMIIRR